MRPECRGVGSVPLRLGSAQDSDAPRGQLACMRVLLLPRGTMSRRPLYSVIALLVAPIWAHAQAPGFGAQLRD